MNKLSLIAIALLLTACGGGGGGYVGVDPVPPPATPPPVPVDSFVTAVTSYLVSSAENTDATPIDSVVSTQPESTEPSPIP